MPAAVEKMDGAVRELDEATLKQAFALADTDPRWRAWVSILKASIDANVETLASSGLSSDHGQLAFYAGAVATQRLFLEQVQEYRRLALLDVENSPP